MIKLIEIDSEFGGCYIGNDLITDLELFIVTSLKLGYKISFQIMTEIKD